MAYLIKNLFFLCVWGGGGGGGGGGVGGWGEEGIHFFKLHRKIYPIINAINILILISYYCPLWSI